jgi:chromosome partitioning protein
MASAAIQTDTNSETLSQIQHSHNMAVRVLQKTRERHIMSNPPRTGPTFKISEAASLVCRSASAIRVAEDEGRLPAKERNDLGRRQGYTLEDLDRMRGLFETRPWKQPDDPTAIVAIQNFKGGVGKSTLSVHLAQYLAVRGYRVLLADADAQASSTMMFGYIPDHDLDETDTLYGLLADPRPGKVKQLIRKTHYHNLDLIPANLKLYNSEYELAARIHKHGFQVLNTLSVYLAEIVNDYDVIILDPPPALGMVSLSVLYAANALIVPVPPSIIDFASTTSFLGMLEETLTTLGEHDMMPEYGFIQMILSKHDSSQSQSEIAELIDAVYGKMVFNSRIRSSAEFGNASARLQSVFDLSSATTNHQVRSRCLSQLNNAGAELEKHVRALWPSTASTEV